MSALRCRSAGTGRIRALKRVVQPGGEQRRGIDGRAAEDPHVQFLPGMIRKWDGACPEIFQEEGPHRGGDLFNIPDV